LRGVPRALDARDLRRTFLDLLARPPLPLERDSWLGKAREELLESVLATGEFWRAWLEEQLYYFLLIDNFRPSAESVEALSRQLTAGEIGVREVLHRVCLSSSFDRRNPGPDTYVTVVMEQVLGIHVQRSPRELEIGKKVYDGRKGTFLGRPGSSQADIVHNAISDARSLEHLVRREHERLLRRPAADQVIAAWAASLERDPLCFPSILGAWLLSEAYDRRLETNAQQPNHLFIRALHVDLLGRLPDEAESQRMRSALDGLAESGPLRSLLARLILDSGKVPLAERATLADPASWIRGLFERLLGRPPNGTELGAFLESFADPACRTATIVYAIVSHPEYQTW
jgi:hypothetical protein